MLLPEFEQIAFMEKTGVREILSVLGDDENGINFLCTQVSGGRKNGIRITGIRYADGMRHSVFIPFII